jgi:hypothetical protein
VVLTTDDLARIEQAAPRGSVAGDRYPPDRMPTWTSPRR